ncbi:MAG: hypothetical protein Q9191_002264 [Dirinaria sp. TL-2023a]
MNSSATSSHAAPISVLFVCLGNICRSTMAEGIFRSLTKSHPRIGRVDSAGTSGYNIGSGPDMRTVATLEGNGIGDYDHEARRLRPSDLTNFDYIFAMDGENLHNIHQMQRRMARKRPTLAFGKIMLFGDFGGNAGEEVVDPYYGALDGFEIAYEQLTRFSKGFIEEVIGQP